MAQTCQKYRSRDMDVGDAESLQVSAAFQLQSGRLTGHAQQSEQAAGQAVPQATHSLTGDQVSEPTYVFTDELFDKCPPPAHLEIDEAAFKELRAELLGQKMGGRAPNSEQLKNFECIEQYLLYNSYVSYW